MLHVEILKECVGNELGVSAKDIFLSPISTGKFNTSFFIHINGKSKYVLRVAPPPHTPLIFYEKDMMRQEPYIHDIVLKSTNIPVPKIIAYDFSRSKISSDYLIMERKPGKPMDINTTSRNKIFQKIGKYLKTLHTKVIGTQYGYVGPHSPMVPQNSWVNAFEIMWRKMIDQIKSIGYYNSQEHLFLLKLLEEHIKFFDRNVPPSLLHMDIWEENILVENEEITGIIDWDRALWGDPEIEFAVLDYCGISGESFWEGYGSKRDTSLEAQIRHVFYFLYEVQKYIIIRHARNKNPVAAQQYKYYVMRILTNAQKRLFSKL